MKTLLTTSLFLLISFAFNAQASQPIKLNGNLFLCNNCSQYNLDTHARSWLSDEQFGEFELKYLDMEKGIYSKVIVRIVGDTLPTGEGNEGNEVINNIKVDVNIKSDDEYLNAQLKSLNESSDEIDKVLASGYTLDSSFPYKDVYGALLYKQAFMNRLENFINHDPRISTIFENSMVIANNILGRTNLTLSARVVGISFNAINNGSVTVNFSDGTSVKVKVDLQIIDGSLNLKVVSVGIAYDENGKIIPASPIELRNGTFSSSSIDFVPYIESFGVTVTGGGGSTTCSTEMYCGKDGTHCVAKLVSCE